MTVKVKVDDAKVRAMFGEQRKRAALSACISNVRSDTENYVPYRSGYLSDTSLDMSQAEEGIIAWRATYATRVYYMPASCNWTRTRHPQAGPQWVERSQAVNGERWRKIIAAVIRGN